MDGCSSSNFFPKSSADSPRDILMAFVPLPAPGLWLLPTVWTRVAYHTCRLWPRRTRRGPGRGGAGPLSTTLCGDQRGTSLPPVVGEGGPQITVLMVPTVLSMGV